MNKPPRGLGRGLDALLPAIPAAAPSAPPAQGTTPPSQPAPVATPATSAVGGTVFSCAIEKLSPQPGQPRQYFDPTALEELAQSIREHGLIEPLLVRRIGQDRFEIIAGERRWRAAQIAGLEAIPAVIRRVPDEAAIAMALIENIQREDLNPLE
ncbi:MAG TPA: ParB/RepB/Spo0J family partition protein, partial [Polyangiaceae bacterium]|nr:ParB/RepB/Spo0J family partition protein [Polyangiaceae bacterium]